MRSLRDISIQFIKGVGPARKKLFYNLGIENVEDLLYFFPRRYEDRTQMTKLAQVKIGEYQTVTGKVKTRSSRKSWYTKKHVYETTIDDGSGRLFCVWFNMPYLEHYFKMGRQVVLYGKVEIYKNRMQMVSPEYEFIDKDDESLSIGRIVPIYPLTRGITQRYIRKVTGNCLDKYLDELKDILPVWIRNKQKLFNLKRSIQNIHFPENIKDQQEAHRRISFEEFFLFQISVMLRRMSIVTKHGIEHKISLDLINSFKRLFPFELTNAQNRVINEIAGDMQQSSPMLRLLQGDVGSGKTLVALFGCIAALSNNKQSAVMVPTEILARQHFENIKGILDKGGFKNIRVELLVSNIKKSKKDKVYEDLKNGDIDILVGTHALLSEEVDFNDLSFVVIDEQHKFGVRQRALLSKKGTNPDILVMTATPIPRTLSITLFGDLDLSIIDEMPKQRGSIETSLYTLENAEEVYTQVKEIVLKGQQAYIIYPIIEESMKLDLKAAEEMYKHFQKDQFKELNVGLVHGQMKKDESDRIMNEFKNKKIDILVATTVLEVGVDVPNANVMVIEHAERFGLSQLHQLRGRIGRGKVDAKCFLISEPTTDEGNMRLNAILSSNDGFKIAEQDLMIRGPGHYFGRHQHGLNELRFVDPARQIDILEVARSEATEVVHKDPNLSEKQNTVLKKIIQERYPNYLKMVEAG